MLALLALYVTATALYMYFFAARSEPAEKAGIVVLSVGFLVHTVSLIVAYAEGGRFPVINLKESLCFFSWSLVGFYLVVRMVGPARTMGVFVTPLATAFFIGSGALTGSPHVPDQFQTPWFPIHILLAFLGHAAFAFAAGSSIMYLFQEKGLKGRNPGPLLKRLPSLNELDELNYRSITIGFFMLSLGIASGAIWLHNIEGSFLKLDPKILSSIVTWLFYAVILHTRLITGWRGKRTALLSLAGFVLVLFTFLGAGLIKGGFHDFF